MAQTNIRNSKTLNNCETYDGDSDASRGALS